MSDTIYCLVSRIAKAVPVVNGEIETNTVQIIACSFEDNNREIAIGEGWAPHDNGGITTPAKVLSRDHYRIFLRDGRNRYEKEEAGVWFERECASLDCPWFPSMVRRMALGEIVPIREIQNAYRHHNNGEEIPTGKWSELEIAWNVISSRAKLARRI